MKQEINGWIIAKFTTEQKGSLDTFLTSFPQAYDLFSQCWFSSSKASGTVYPLNELVVTFPGGGGEGLNKVLYWNTPLWGPTP